MAQFGVVKKSVPVAYLLLHLLLLVHVGKNHAVLAVAATAATTTTTTSLSSETAAFALRQQQQQEQQQQCLPRPILPDEKQATAKKPTRPELLSSNYGDDVSTRRTSILLQDSFGRITPIILEEYVFDMNPNVAALSQVDWRNRITNDIVATTAAAAANDGTPETTTTPVLDNDNDAAAAASSTSAASSDEDETAAVGVKSHHSSSSSSKKSNAVGDPDGEGSDSEDDDDDDNDDEEEWQELQEELLEEMQSLMEQQQKLSSVTAAAAAAASLSGSPTALTTTHQVEVEVEFVDEEPDAAEEVKKATASTSHSDADSDENSIVAAASSSTLVNANDDDGEDSTMATTTAAASKSSLGSGGVGVRSLGQRLGRRNVSRNQQQHHLKDLLPEEGGQAMQEQSAAAMMPSLSVEEQQLIDAWLPHVFLPPSTKAFDHLKRNARSVDGASKLRLDRRTLYAGLLMEWNSNRLSNTNKSKIKLGNNQSASRSNNDNATTTTSGFRKFLTTATSQSLQAALALATQPKWRRSFSRPNGLRLYNTIENNNSNNMDKSNSNANHRPCTLAMQETIAMALAHSLGAGFVILDDANLAAVQESLLVAKRRHGGSGGLNKEETVKPAALIQSLLDLARHGKVEMRAKSLADINNSSMARISKYMQHEIHNGLEDPFDERAASSCHEMTEWEAHWLESEDDSSGDASQNGQDIKSDPLPLVLFVRSQASKGLLKSKSGVEVLLGECNSSEGINLIVLGKGIDANTETLPPDAMDGEGGGGAHQQQHRQHGSGRHLNSAAPFFDFAPNNQNASGQNDPPGSRRFNIFLARTVDAEGSQGILGAVAPPQAGNLFPHMMAMQARERLQRQQQNGGDDSAIKAELEKWAQNLQQQMQTDGGEPLPPPQFFNASLSTSTSTGTTTTSTPYGTPSLPNGMQPPSIPPPEVIKETLQQAMSELLDRLADLNEENGGRDEPGLSPDLHKAFAQVLRNENLRKGIAENLARAAPALSDPKCQGVMLSVYVPPMSPQFQQQRPSFVVPPPASQPPEPQQQSKNNSSKGKSHQYMNGWFQRMLNHQEEQEKSRNDESNGNTSEEEREHAKQRRVRTMAAAAAVIAAGNASAKNETVEDKAERNLARLESLCRPVVVPTPADPVRAKSWEAWISRERGAVVFRQNRNSLNERLQHHQLSLQVHTGAHGAGSSLRGMLSVRDLSDEMDGVIKCAIELEAARSQRQHESPEESLARESVLDIDVTLSQLFLSEEDGAPDLNEPTYSLSLGGGGAATKLEEEKPVTQYLHPSSLETALSMVSRISACPSGGMFLASTAASHRSREEIAALAQDKHERALISQVVSPQDIGVTYDMIGGLSNVKELLRQSITYPLKFPHLYSEGIAREAVKGVLLFGPPGTGKTMLAKAVATEGGASFLSVDASSVENKWLGESEKNAKAVFTLARRLAPCVIFIDEVDSLLSSRDGTSDDSAHGTLTSVKTTMMSEWDGLNSGTNGAGEAGSDRVVVIGSTNRPFDLDEAVLRRFPRRILVDLPDLQTREEILEVTLAENRLDPAVNLTEIAERLDGFTGSDLKEVCREAVVRISHEQARLLDMGFTNAREDVTQGSLQRLRPVTYEDFEIALSKIKKSVSEKGRELARVWEWNDEYGEIKKEKKNHLPHLANMYL